MRYSLKIISSKDYEKLADKYPAKLRSRIINSEGFTDMDRNISFVRSRRDDFQTAGTAIHEIFEQFSDVSPHEESRLRFKGGSQPTAPTYQLPEWAQNLPPEIIQYIQQGVGGQLQMPSEYGTASQTLQGLLGYQPDQFAYPMQEIQQALSAQQGLGMEQYLQQIRPIMAQQGQLDSSAYTNLISDFMKGQQAQTYGTTADLLTNQAQQNLQIQQWLPQFQASIAQALQGVGGAQANIEQYNLQYPYQTYIPALSNLYGQGAQQAGQEYNSALNQYQAAMQQYNQDQASQSGMFGALGSLGGAGLGALLALPTGGLSVGAGAMLGGSLGGTASSLFGGSGGSIPLSTALNYAYPQTARYPWQMSSGMAGSGGIIPGYTTGY